MIKIVNRIIIANLLVTYFLSWFYPMAVSGKLTELGLGKILFLFWIFLSGVSAFYFIGYLFYHWYKQQYSNKGWKILWFFVLLIGMVVKFYGPVIYYLLVVEFKMTLPKKA